MAVVNEETNLLSGDGNEEFTPIERRGRSESFVPDIVIQSIENIQENVEEVIHDLVTFEPLDEEELVAKAEEAGVIELDDQTLASDEVKEIIEEFVHPDDPMDPFVERERLGVLPLAIIVFYNVSGKLSSRIRIFLCITHHDSQCSAMFWRLTVSAMRCTPFFVDLFRWTIWSGNYGPCWREFL